MAKKKKKKGVVPEDLRESAHKIWLAGLGAVAVAEEEGSKLFNKLVKKGEGLEKVGAEAVKDSVDQAKKTLGAAKEKAASTWEDLEETLEERVSGVVESLGVPSRDEVRRLTERVEALAAQLAATEKKATPRKRTTTRKTTARKAPVKKTTARKPAAKKATTGSSGSTRAKTS